VQLNSPSPFYTHMVPFCPGAFLQEGHTQVKLLGCQGFGADCLGKAQNSCKTATLNTLSSLCSGPSVNHRITSCWHHWGEPSLEMQPRPQGLSSRRWGGQLDPPEDRNTPRRPWLWPDYANVQERWNYKMIPCALPSLPCLPAAASTPASLHLRR